MSDERPFHERDLYRRYVDRGIAIDTALVWFKDNDFMGLHADECAIIQWFDSQTDLDWNAMLPVLDVQSPVPDCTCAFGRLVKQLEGVK